MPRPHCLRRIGWVPKIWCFYPETLENPQEIVLTLDELEAIRLADFEGLYQEEAAQRMGISRPTFGRILENARKKVAEALILGKSLRIEGGPVYQEEFPFSPHRCRCWKGWRGQGSCRT